MCREEETEGLVGRGGCHRCPGTSKDSSADVSKQDGCQVGLVNYFSNKSRLVFMQHARFGALYAFVGFFNAAGTCLVPNFDLFKSE